MPSRKSFETLKFDEDNISKGFKDSNIDGINIMFLEGGREALHKQWGWKS